MTFNVNANTINSDKINILKDGMKPIKFTDQNGKEHIHKRFPMQYEYDQAGNADLYYIGGNITEPTKEDSLAHCLKCSLSTNKFRKSYEQDMKDENGKLLLDSNGQPRKEIVQSGSPYSFFISPRKGKDPEFDAFDEGTSVLRKGAIEGFMKSTMFEEEGYSAYFKTSDGCGVGVMKEICNHPLVEGSTVKRNINKPKFAVYDVYDNAPFQVPVKKDSSGKIIHRNLDKKLLAKNNVDVYCIPKFKYHMFHVGGGRLSLRSYCIGASVLAIKKRDTGTNIDDIHTGQVGKVDIKAMEDSIKNMELEFDENEKKKEVVPVEKKEVVLVEKKVVSVPSTIGVMTDTTSTPVGTPVVDMSSLGQYLEK